MHFQNLKIHPRKLFFVWVMMLVACSLTFSATASAQPKSAVKLQQQVERAIDVARPACVRMWGYDTLLQQRNSAQFSGVVVKDGYILTAAHVATPGNTYQVMFPDGKHCIAKALGKIELSEDKTRPDIALMQIVTKGMWPYAEIASSKDLRSFDYCISITYPESLNQPEPIVRLGKISDPLNSRGFIKSTCLMEPGDSGGPLFDVEGHVIGIHSAIEVPEQNNYDAPADLFIKYWAALLKVTTYHTLPGADIIQTGSPLQLKQPANARFGNLGGPAAWKHNDHDVVRIQSKINGQQQVISGTVISLRGSSMEKAFGSSVVISKSSMVGDSVAITLIDKQKIAASVIFRDKVTDLVLLRTAAPLLARVELRQLAAQKASMKQGSMLISPLVDSDAVISVLGSGSLNLPKNSSAGFLGATAARNSKPAKIYFVRPGSPAALNDIQADDIVTSVGDTKIDSAAAYAAALLNYWPGDTIKLSIKRQNADIRKVILLTYPPQIKYDHPAEYFTGGKSQRRDGFNGVYVNDAILQPMQCGGPVFNLQDQLLGIQIARYSRTGSLFIGADVVVKFINDAFKNYDIKQKR